MEDLKLLFQTFSFDVVGITETKLYRHMQMASFKCQATIGLGKIGKVGLVAVA